MAITFFAITPGFADEPSGAVLHALDTMAPAGRWAARLELRSNGYDVWYDNNGNKTPFSSSYDNVDLNSSVFPSLALLGPGATLGTTRLRSEVTSDIAQLTMGYGVTENVTVGFILPYNRNKNQIDFSVSGGNVGFNPAFDPSQPLGPANFPFAPAGGGVAPMDTAGVQRILTDPAFGFGYKPIESTTTSGFGDPTVGALWRIYKSSIDSVVLGLGVHFGIAKEDDPDNLADVAPDDGSNDLEARLDYFRRLGDVWDLRLMGRYQEQLSDHVERRVPAPGELLPTAASKERLKRDLGDFREFDIELGRTWGDWRGSVTWHRYEKEADSYTSDKGTNTGALSENTKVRADQWRIGLSWSGIKSWQAGKFPLPLIVKLEFQDTYDGRNFPKVRDLYLQLTSFF